MICRHMTDYRRHPISNGHPTEQALIRRWWHEVHAGRGRMVWEYYLEGRYLDAVWFPDVLGVGDESDGRAAPRKHPIKGIKVVLCEAKADGLTPGLIGQALVHRQYAAHAGAIVRDTVVFSAKAADSIKRAAAELGLSVVVTPS
jgi:hypothetical protein